MGQGTKFLLLVHISNRIMTFNFICTFLLEDLCFPTAILGFVSTFSGRRLAANLADLLLGPFFTMPSAELTFVLGILAVHSACWLWCADSLDEAGLSGHCSSSCPGQSCLIWILWLTGFVVL